MGPFIMIVGVIAMIVIHEGGHFLAAKAFGMKATEAFFGFGPRLWSTTKGETEYGIKAIPFGGYVRIIGMNPFEEVAPEEEGRTYRVAAYWKKTVVVLAGIASHFVVAIVLLWAVNWAAGVVAIDADGDPVLTTTIAAVAETTESVDGTIETPASEAGVEAGDVIVSTDGLAVEVWDDFTDFTEAHPGRDVAIGIEREGEALILDVTLATVERTLFDDNGNAVLDENGDPISYEAGFFGVVPEAEIETLGAFAAIPETFSQLWEGIVGSVEGLWRMIIGFPELVASLFSGNEDVTNEVRPISPIGLVGLAGDIAPTLRLLAYVNIFVGVLNLVPLYPLDGGHFAVATYEKVTGREPDITKMIPVAAVVLLFLVSIGLIGVFLDIFRPIT